MKTAQRSSSEMSETVSERGVKINKNLTSNEELCFQVTQDSGNATQSTCKEVSSILPVSKQINSEVKNDLEIVSSNLKSHNENENRISNPTNYVRIDLPKVEDSDETISNISNEAKEATLEPGKDVSTLSESIEDKNQNYHSDDSMEYPRRRHHSYLERNADPRLKDVLCKLTLRAALLRDGELRDLVDDMIFLTNDALGQAGLQYNSRPDYSRPGFDDENRRLHKRINALNQQLYAREHQASVNMPTVDRELERENIYCQQERERLDSQVTALLEEKARWLLTQQELVKSLSLKDHEMVQLEAQHQENMKSLHQAIEHSARKSQGMHYKLSVADKEITNLEKRLKAREEELRDLKDMMQETTDRLERCESMKFEKEAKVNKLEGLVRSLKEGVDIVLRAFEDSSRHSGSTAEQQRGIDFLRQIFSSESSDDTTRYNLPQPARNIARTQEESPESMGSSEYRDPPPRQGPGHTSSPISHLYKSVRNSLDKYLEKSRSKSKSPESSHGRHWDKHNLESISIDDLEDSSRYNIPFPKKSKSKEKSTKVRGRSPYKRDSETKHRSELRDRRRHHSDSAAQRGMRKLTEEALREHNQQYSPVDRSLWKNAINQPTNKEAHHSDTEVTAYHKSRGKKLKSKKKRRHSAGDLKRSKKSSDVNRTSLDSTIKSRPIVTDSLLDTLEDQPNEDSTDKLGSNFSTLRSRSIRKSKEQLMRMSEVLRGDDSQDEFWMRPMPDPDQPDEFWKKPPRFRSSGMDEFWIRSDSWDPNNQGGIPANNPPHGMSSYKETDRLSLSSHSDFIRRPDTPPVRNQIITVSANEHQNSPQYSQGQRHLLGAFRRPSNDNESPVKNPVTFQDDGRNRRKHDEPSRASPERGPSWDSRNLPLRVSTKIYPTGEKVDELIPDDSSISSRFVFDKSKLPSSTSSTRPHGSKSRRATKGSDDVTQRDFFQGTEFSESFSSISDDENYSNNQTKFVTGIASLDAKIASLEAKINKAKATFS